MKKTITLCLILFVIALTGCKHSVTTYYSIGCQNFNVSSQSDVTGFEQYMSETVEYNKTVQFTSNTIEENDVKAATHFNEEYAKVDAAKACSYLHGSDFITYGIAKSVDGNTVIIRSVQFTGNGIAND